MNEEKEGTKLCKYCKSEIPAGAKICPNCRKKQGKSGCLIAVIAVVVVFIILMAIGGGSESAKKGFEDGLNGTSSTSSSSSAQQESSASSKSSADTKSSESSEPAKESSDTVIYDQNGIKITAKGLKDSLMGTDLVLKIENTTDTNYTVQVRDVSVNGYMVDPMFSCDVAAGKNANGGITILSSELKDNDIDKIEDIEFKFHIFDSDTWSETIDTDIISLQF